MNILFINENNIFKTIGGVQSATRILAEHFIALKFKPYFVTYDSVIVKFKQKGNFTLYTNMEEKQLVNLSDFIKEFSINIIINQFGFNLNLVEDIRRENERIPLVSVFHSSPDFELINLSIIKKDNLFKKDLKFLYYKSFLYQIYYYLKRKKLQKKLKKIYLLSSKIILLSPTHISIFTKLIKRKELSKIMIIGNPIDPNFYSLNRANILKENRILYVGRITHGKRLNVLIDIWSKIGTLQRDWFFDIVGDGPLLESLVEQTKQNNIQNVNFFGNRIDVEYFYSRSKIFVMASAFEGFPMALLEAQFFGTIPIVFNSFSSAEELIENHKNGFLIPELDKDKFLDCITKLMIDNSLQNKMNVENQIRIKKYNIKYFGERWVKLFIELLPN